MKKSDENRCRALKIACSEWMQTYDRICNIDAIIRNNGNSSPSHTALLIHMRSVADGWKSFVILLTGFDYNFVEDMESAMKDSYTFTPVDALLKKHGYKK